MNTCKNCLWWEDYCHTGYGECHMAKSKNGKSVQPYTMALALDSEEYDAHLETYRDFYCNQWKEK